MKGMTRNQLELLTVVRAGGPDGPIDFDQLLERLSWRPSKESAQFSIRALVNKGLLEKLPELQLRRSRKRICYQLSPEGLKCLDPRGPLAGLPEVGAEETPPRSGKTGKVSPPTPGVGFELTELQPEEKTSRVPSMEVSDDMFEGLDFSPPGGAEVWIEAG